MSNSLQPHGLQLIRLPSPSPSLGACSNSCPLSWWYLPIISFSSPQSFPASESFPVSQLFASGGQSIGSSASALVLSMNIQGCFPLGLTGLISLQSKGLWLSRVFFSTTVQKHHFADKGQYSQAMVFSEVTYGCESWTIKKAECWSTDAFELWYAGEGSWEFFGQQGDQTSQS